MRNTVRNFLNGKSFLLRTYPYMLITSIPNTVPVTVTNIVTPYDTKSFFPYFKTARNPSSDSAEGSSLYPSLARTLSSVNAVVKTNRTGIAVVIASISSIKKRTHNIKPVFAAAEKCGYGCEGIVFDSELAAYLLNPNASDYNMDRLVSEYCVSPLKACCQLT